MRTGIYWSRARSYSCKALLMALESRAILASWIDFVFLRRVSMCLLASSSNFLKASSFDVWYRMKFSRNSKSSCDRHL